MQTAYLCSVLFFYDWHPIIILFMYWQEAVVVGLYNFPKIFFAQIPNNLNQAQQKELEETIESRDFVDTIGAHKIDTLKKLVSGRTDSRITSSKLVTALFFTLHYSIFLMGCLYLIDITNEWVGGIEKLSVFNAALISFFVSHGFSFWFNFYNNSEYRNVSVSQQMIVPYKRIGILLVSIMFGVILSLLTHTSDSLIIVFVLIKIIIDVCLHVSSHRHQV